MEKYYLAIDDTDNLESRGTGYYSRQLASRINQSGLGRVEGITRHQLFVHDSIPYTSQNSSACLVVQTEQARPLWNYCREYILSIAAIGSDAGLCLASYQSVSEVVMEFGARAKSEVLFAQDALDTALSNLIKLEGLTGEKLGVIGALAAVGLRHGGNDGRFIWLESQEELRQIKPGKYLVGDMKRIFNFDAVISGTGLLLENKEEVLLDEWVIPVLKDHKAVLFVEKDNKFEPQLQIWMDKHIKRAYPAYLVT